MLISGISFAYLISLPVAIGFLGKFSSDDIKSLISTNEYFSFVTRYLISFGIFYQLPLIMIFINRIQPLGFKQLLKFERWIILGSFIISGIISPTTDFLNQIIMASPIILLYQISILIIWLLNKRRNKSSKALFTS